MSNKPISLLIDNWTLQCVGELLERGRPAPNFSPRLNESLFD